MKHFILMADIIDSGSKDSRKLMSDFKSVVNSVNEKYCKYIESPITITLGDEFQGVISDLKTSIEIIIYIEEEFIRSNLNFKLRYVVYQGLIDTLINNKIAFEMLGPGLTESRERLSRLKISKHRFYVSLDDKNISEILNNSFLLLEILISKWNPYKDYQTVSYYIDYEDYKKVSVLLNKNRSLVWKRGKSLNIESYNAIKNIILTISKLQYQ
jgi:hypothetical protein